jgi:hypothetical protein
LKSAGHIHLPFRDEFDKSRILRHRDKEGAVVVLALNRPYVLFLHVHRLKPNMSRNPYDTVGIILILLVDETQNEKADGRQLTKLNTLGLAGRPLATHREGA